MKLTENPFSNPPQRPYSGDFDPENAHRQLTVNLKIVLKAGYYVYIVHWTKRLIADKQRRKATNGREEKLKTLMRLSGLSHLR